MKKLLLLLASGSIALSSVAQNRLMSFDQVLPMYQYDDLLPKQSAGTANKTTAAPTRWYSYTSYLNTMLAATLGQQISNVRFPIWNDTTMQINYTAGPSHINQPSIGSIFDPSSVGFNDPAYYLGEMKVDHGDAYTIDSVQLVGVYKATPSTTSVVDTIRLSFIVGGGGAAASDHIYGSGTTGGHYGAAKFLNMRHDSVRNYAKPGGTAIGSAAPNVQDIYLDNTTYADTNVNGTWFRTIVLTTPVAATASQFVGMSITFISGEPGLAANTIIYDATTGAAAHNIWFPSVGFASDGTTAQWAPYYAAPDPKADSNVGLFKRYPGTNGWDGEYVPTFAWFASSGGAAQSQFPNVAWHVTCTSCGNVPPAVNVSDITSKTIINAYPNPAGTELNIPFKLANVSNVKITLSNMLGQVVASKNMTNVASGNAVFNTSSLPAGLYTYSVSANGERNSGRVVVSH